MSRGRIKGYNRYTRSGPDKDRAEIRSLLEGYGAKAFRAACYSLNLRIKKTGVDRNDNKTGCICLMVSAYLAQRHYDQNPGPNKESNVMFSPVARKTKFCIYRLINVLFSDEFSSRLHEIDATPTRVELDERKTGALNSFWTDVEAAFAMKKDEYDVIDSTDPVFNGIKPSKPVHHTGRKLRSMRNDLKARFNTAYSILNDQATTTRIFFSFCHGSIDIYYLPVRLGKCPDLLSHVEVKLPEAARFDSLSKRTIDLTGGNTDKKKPKTITIDRLLSAIESEEDKTIGLVKQIKDRTEQERARDDSKRASERKESAYREYQIILETIQRLLQMQSTGVEVGYPADVMQMLTEDLELHLKRRESLRSEM